MTIIAYLIEVGPDAYVCIRRKPADAEVEALRAAFKQRCTLTLEEMIKANRKPRKKKGKQQSATIVIKQRRDDDQDDEADQLDQEPSVRVRVTFCKASLELLFEEAQRRDQQIVIFELPKAAAEVH